MEKLNIKVWQFGVAFSALVVWALMYIYCPGNGLIWTAFKWIVLTAGAVIATIYCMLELYDFLPSGECPVAFLGFSSLLTSVVIEHMITGVLFCVSVLALPVGAFMLLMTPFIILYFAIADVVYLMILAVFRTRDELQYRSDTGKFLCPECGKGFCRPEYNVDGTRI